MNVWTVMRHSECHEYVSREGHAEPCHCRAVALRRDPESNEPYPVCGRHARINDPLMLSLPEIRDLIEEETTT